MSQSNQNSNIHPEQQAPLLESWEKSSWSLYSAQELFSRLYQPLGTWLHRHGIRYPWSHSTSDISIKTETFPEPYAVWISEVMLQQTRTETARSYYQEWMQRWPDFQSLAQANEQEVLRQWEGLGYYNRARNILRCAQSISRLPLDAEQLQKLPGIGSYIAAAVASISGNQAILAIDTNVQRIFSRLYLSQPDAAQQRLWHKQHHGALQLCSWRGAANISLIQLGQQLCKARDPLCSRCPLQNDCRGGKRWQQFPAPKVYQRHKVQSRRLLCSPPGEPDCYLLLQNPEQAGLLQGFWLLPHYGQLNSSHLAGYRLGAHLGSFQHAYLQTQEQVEVFRCQLSRKALPTPLLPGGRWVTADEAAQLPMPGPYRKFLRQLGSKR